jgi:Ca2+-binding RTX toxin-like protein
MANIITGTDNGETLTGTDGDDVVFGKGGDDFIYLLDGTIDVAEGGEGDDYVEGGEGQDVVYGGPGADHLLGAAGDDVIYGGHNVNDGPGDDWIEGGEGNDTLVGGLGSDLVEGGAGNDSIADDKGGSDELYGGDGDDFISLSRFSGMAGTVSEMDGGIGDDQFAIGALTEGATARISGGDGDDKVHLYLISGLVEIGLGAGHDTIVFNPAVPQFHPEGTIVLTDFETGTGDRIDLRDWLEAATPNWSPIHDPFVTGHLVLQQDGADAVLLLDVDGGQGPALAPIEWIRFRNVQASALTPENLGGYLPGSTDFFAPRETEIGTNAADYIVGWAGHDELRGLDGDDRIFGGGGRDYIFGGAGHDRIEGEHEGDTIDGEDGDDRIDGGSGDDSLYGGAGADQIDGGTGHDYLRGDAGDDVLRGGIGNDTLSDGFNTATGNDLLYGEDGNDWLNSDTGNDLLEGGAGNDRLYISRSSLSSFDTSQLNGGTGDDLFIVSTQNFATVNLDAGTGSDRVEIDNTHYRLRIAFNPDGSDTIELSNLFGYWYLGSQVEVTGFARGDGGARIEWDEFLGRALPNWDGVANPFGVGQARIFTDGDGIQRLQINPDLHPNGWFTVMKLGPDTGTAFTAHNFDGFAPDGSPAIGTVLAGTNAAQEDLLGTNGSDTIDGHGGNDNIYGLSGADTIRGGAGNDYVEGGPGPDRIEGGIGDDMLLGGFGDDLVYGGEGNDRLEENWTAGAGGSDSLYGEGGDDFFLLYRTPQQPAGTHYFSGGDGSDYFLVALDNAGLMIIDGGAGDDRVALTGQRNGARAAVTLGEGRDTLQLHGGRFHDLNNSFVRVTDFAAGALGDRIDFGTSFSQWLTGWTAGANPFSSGHLGLVPDATGGARLLIDSNGGGDGFITLVTFDPLDLLALTAENLGGWAPPIASGTDAAETIIGSAGTNLLLGLGGSDIFRLEQGGDDAASGGAGNDAFIFGGALTAADHVDGGEGADQLGLQGNYAMRLGPKSLVGIETLALLSGADTRFGDPGTNFYSYDLTTVDANVAAGQQLKVNYNGLRVGENVTFNGSAESDGAFFIFAGKGNDRLTGGAKDDAFYFGAEGQFSAADRIDGGAGRDQLGLRGDYDVTFGATTITNVESLALLSGQDTRFGGAAPPFTYVIATHDDNVAAGQQLSVNAAQLRAGETVTFDGSAESNGTFRILSGQANDSLTGGAGNDFLHGSLGADYLKGGGGADTYFYRFATESTGPNFDRIDGFVFGTDKLDMPGTHDSYGQVSGGTLSTASFDADLAAAMAGQLDPSEAIFFTPNAGDQAGKLFLIVDQNGTAGYQAGQDFVIELAGAALPGLPPPDFIV